VSLHLSRRVSSPEGKKEEMDEVRGLMTGWQLGSDPEIQVATNVTNHLTAATLKYFADSFRLGRAANLFEKMAEKEPEVAALLARAYIGMSKSYILF
jgi:hypothetical protein